MRWSALSLAILLSGCVVPLEDASPRDECLGHGYSLAGVLPGAWAAASGNGTGNGTWETVHWDGIPAGPRAQDLLGSPANVTSVRWRVDGGPVEEADHVSSRDGRLTSPEYLEVRFTGSVGGMRPVLDGVLDPERSPEGAADAVRRFLDVVRGPLEDNAPIAEAFAPVAQRRAAPQLTVIQVDGAPIQRTHEDPGPVHLPDGPWAVASHLGASVRSARFLDEPLSPSFVHGAWLWELAVPYAAHRNQSGDALWVVHVDARDRASLHLAARDAHNETALADAAARHLAFLDLPAPEPWRHVSAEGWPAYYCDPA